MKWNFSLPETPILVYYFAKMTGLAPFIVKKDKFYPPTIPCKIYLVSIAAIYSFITIMSFDSMIKKVKEINFYRITTIFGTLQHFVSFPATLLIPIIFFINHKQILWIMNKLCNISKEVKRFGIEEDNGKFFKNLLVTSVLTNALLIATCVMLIFMEFNWPVSLSITYCISSWLRLNTVMIFAHMLFFIRQYFKLINDKLSDMFKPDGHVPVAHNSQVFVLNRSPSEETQTGVDDLTDLQRIRKIELLHLELCHLVNRTFHLFAIPLLLKSLQFSIELILYCVWIYSVSGDFQQLSSAPEIVSSLMSILCSVLRIVILLVELFTIVMATTKICEEGNSTRVVLYKVWNTSTPQSLKNEFHIFSLQLMQKPVSGSVLEFFDLDYSYLYKMFCIVMAYVIIMIQYDPSNSNSGT